MATSRFSGHKQDLALQAYCSGEDDGFDALCWWNGLQDNDIIVRKTHSKSFKNFRSLILYCVKSWDFFLPIFIYTVAVMFCISVLAVVVFNKRTRQEIGTQTDSTGDLNGDSAGLSEKVSQQLAQIRELEGRRDTTDATVDRQKGEIQLKDREIRGLKIKLSGLREANAHLQAKKEDQPSQGQDLAERQSKANDDDTALNQVHEDLAQAKGLRILVTYCCFGLKQLAEIFGRVSMGNHLLNFTREIERKCEAMSASGIKSLEEVQASLSDGLTGLLRDASKYAAELRLPKQSKRLIAKPNALAPKRKNQRQRRHTRLLLKKLGQVQATSGDQTRLIQNMRDEHTKAIEKMRNDHSTTIENMRNEHMTIVGNLELQISMSQVCTDVPAEGGVADETDWNEMLGLINEETFGPCDDSFLMNGNFYVPDQETWNLEAPLAEPQAQVADFEPGLNQDPTPDAADLSVAIHILKQDIEEYKKRETELCLERDMLNAEVANLREDRMRLLNTHGPNAETPDLEEESAKANKLYSEEAQKRAALQDELFKKNQELSKVKQEATEFAALLGSSDNCLCPEHRGIQDEVRELKRKHDQEKKAAGNARASAVAELQVKLIQLENTIGDLQNQLQQARATIDSSIDVVATQRIEELQQQVNKLKADIQEHINTGLMLRKENVELKQRLDQVGRGQSTKKAVGGPFADPAKARANKLQKDVQDLRQEAKLWETMRDRLVNEIRELKTRYEPQNDNGEPQTPLTVQDLQFLLQKEQTTQRLFRP